jgi:putative tRNA adenosine deaminase-associated protein
LLCHDATVVADVVDPDFAVVAVREDGGWRLEKLTPRAWSSLDGLEEVLQSWAVDGVAIGLLGVLDEYLLIARREANHSRLMLNDVASTTEWPLAMDVLDRLSLPEPDEDDLERVQPVGDLQVFADLGFAADEFGSICEDLDLFNDELAEQVAERLGFSAEWERIVEDQ